MNKSVQLFLIKSFVFSLLSWGTIEIFFQFNPFKKYDFSTAYNAAIIDKFARLQSIKSPKVVLIAGSNFAYGINSQILEQALQKPVYNMAMHYDFGTQFMFKQLSPELHKGDTVIMGFEYIVESKGNKKEQLLMASYFSKANEWIDYDDIFEYIGENARRKINAFKINLDRLFTKKIIEGQVSDTTSIFIRNGFNQYGDLVSHYNNPPIRPLPLALLSENTSLQAPIADMNAFYKTMRAKGVSVVFVYPTYSNSSFKHHHKIINKLEKEYQTYAQFPILGKPSDGVFDDSLYHDMAYHLTQKGGDLRTQKLIQLLKGYCKK